MLRIISVLLLILPASLLAQGEGGFAAPFLRMGLGARGISMGGAHTAVADDGFAAYYNPAGLPFLTERHFVTTYSFLSLDRQLHFISYSQNLKPTAGLSIYWLGAGTDNIDGRDLSGNHTYDFSENMNAFGISFSNKFHDKFAVGLTMKIVTQSLDLIEDRLSANDLAFDFGIMAIPFDALKLGVTLKDYKGGLTWDTQSIFEFGTKSTDEFPYSLLLGASYSFDNELLIASSFEFNQWQEERIHFGVEYQRNELYSVRIGADDADISFGGGLYYLVSEGIYTNIDYAFQPDFVGEGGTHLFSWEFIF